MITSDNKAVPNESSDECEEELLFEAVETNNVPVVENFTKDELRRLCQLRRPFPSAWSFPQEECQSAYQRACLLGLTDIVQCMLNTGIKADQIFTGGNSRSTMRGAFLFACQSRSMPTILALLAAGASVDELGSCTPSYFYSFMPRISQRRSSMELTLTSNWNNLYPIHLAIVDDNIELVKKLITFNTNKLTTDNGLTPLHTACFFNRSITMIDLLLSCGDANAAITSKASDNKFPDEFATDPLLIEHLRPRRLLVCAEKENIHQMSRENQLKSLEEGRSFQIFIQDLTGKPFIVIVDKEETVESLKEKIHNRHGILPYEQRIIYGGKQLQDDHMLNEYDITKNVTLHLVTRKRGG